MRQHKRIISQFTFHDRTGIQNFLENMALKGWMLEKITKWAWHFRRIEPRRVRFAVSYFAKTSSFEPFPPEELLRFREFCEHTGWKFCAEAAQMQIFFNEDEDPVPIETDALLEIESIHKSIKKQLLPSYILLAAVALLNTFTQVSNFLKHPISYLSSNLNLFVLFSVLCLFLMIAVELGSYFIWRRRALKAAERDGSFLPTRGNRSFTLGILYVLIAVFVIFIFGDSNGLTPKIMLLAMGYYFALLLLVHGISDFMKRKKVGAGTNVTLTVIFSFVLSFAMLGVLTWTVAGLEKGDFFEEEEEYALGPDIEYTNDTGHVYTAQNHALPLYPDDLYGHDVPEDVYSNYHFVDRSVLLTAHDCGSRVRYDYDRAWPNFDYESISYHISDFRYAFLRDMALKELLERYDHPRYDGRYEFRSIDPSPWNADEVWQMYGTEYIGGKKNPMDSFILVRGNRLVQLHLFDLPTDEQIAIIADRLMD